jgi:hypothetical protein
VNRVVDWFLLRVANELGLLWKSLQYILVYTKVNMSLPERLVKALNQSKIPYFIVGGVAWVSPASTRHGTGGF